MRTPVKLLIAALLLALLTPLVVGVAAALLIDEQRIKHQLVDIIEANTRGTVTIEGPVSWSFFPSLSLDLHAFSFRLPEDTAQPFAQLNELKLGVKLRPLLHLALETDEIRLDGLRLHLRSNRDGTANWQHIMAPAHATAVVNPKPADANRADAAPPVSIAIASVALSNASVALHNEIDNSLINLSGINLTGKDIRTDGKPFPLALSLDSTFSAHGISSQLTLDTLLSANFDRKHYSADAVNLSIGAAGTPFGAQQVQISLRGAAEFDANTQQATLKPTVIDVADTLRVSLHATLTDVTTAPSLQGHIQLQPFAVNQLLTALGLEPIAFEQPQALSKVSLEADMSATAAQLLLSALQLRLDNTRVSGSVGITNFSQPNYDVVLQGDSIDLDSYATASEVVAPAKPSGKTTAPPPEAPLLPLAQLRDVRAKATLGFDAVHASGVVLNKVNTTVNAAAGLVTVATLNAELYGGAIKGQGAIDARLDTPTMQLDTQLSKVDIAPLAHAVAQLDSVAGTARLAAKLQARGNTIGALKQSLAGSVDFGLDDAVVTGVNIDQLACKAIAQVRGEKIGDIEWPEATAFKHIGGLIQFKQGVGRTDNLAAALANMQVSGQGDLDLPNNSIDYRLALRVSGDVAEPTPTDTADSKPIKSACAVNKKYRSIVWPVRCAGSLNDELAALCRVDTDRLKKVATELLKAEAKSKLLDELLGGDKTPAKAKQWQQQLLDKLF